MSAPLLYPFGIGWTMVNGEVGVSVSLPPPLIWCLYRKSIFDAQNTILCNAHIILISLQSIQLPKHHSYFNWTLSPIQPVSFPPALSEFLGKDMVSVPGRRRWEVQGDWRWPFLLCPRWNSPVEPQTGALKANFSGGNVNLEVSNWVFRVSLTSEVLVPI